MDMLGILFFRYLAFLYSSAWQLNEAAERKHYLLVATSHSEEFQDE